MGVIHLMKKIKNSARFLLDSGLLFEINRKVLHPLGLALHVELDDDSHTKVLFSDVLDSREDPEGFIFSPESFEDGIEKLEKYMAEEGQKMLESRMAKLGYLIQEKPE